MSVPKNEWCCRAEFAAFKILLDKVLRRRGRERLKHRTAIDQFFCDKIYEITMRQRGYFTEIMKEKQGLTTRLQSVLNELTALEDKNHGLRQKLAIRDGSSHNLSSWNENAS